MIHTSPPPNWDNLAKAFGVKWEGSLVVTYAGEIYCPSGVVAPDVLAHEMVHVEQQKGQDMEAMQARYMTDVDYIREMETPAFKAQAEYIDAHMEDNAERWCKKYRIAKKMVEMYKGAFTKETASAIMGL